MSDMWLDSDQDPREQIAPGTDELGVLREYLSRYRLTLELKCADLPPEQLATRSVPPSSLSLLGLVRHLAFVEHVWFHRRLEGRRDRAVPFVDATDDDWEFTGAVGTADCVAEAWETWRREVAAADAWLDSLPTDALGGSVSFGDPAQTTSVRDILVHMVEEYARHVGHADLLRECLDGRTGQ